MFDEGLQLNATSSYQNSTFSPDGRWPAAHIAVLLGLLKRIEVYDFIFSSNHLTGSYILYLPMYSVSVARPHVFYTISHVF